MKAHYKILSLLFACLLMAALSSHAQTINAFAGNSTGGYSGDGGSATAAECFAPAGIATDAAGNVYISDLGNSVIRKVTPDGVITTFAGTGTAGYSGDGGPATAALLNEPTSVTTDTHGNVYFTDDNNNVIRKVDATGTITTVVGSGVAGFAGDGFQAIFAQLNSPSGIAVDKVGRLYIADANNQVIRKVDTSGIIITIAGQAGIAGYGGDGGNAGIATFNYPKGVAVDTLGDVYIVDEANSMVRKYYAGSHNIVRYAGDTTILGAPIFGFSGDGGVATSATLNSPTEVALAPNGTLYIADYNNHRVRKVKSDGEISTIAGNGTGGNTGNGGAATDAEFDGPYGVAISSGGRLYITDEVNNTVRVLDATTAVNNVTETAAIGIFPNPSSGTFTIDIPTIVQNGTITVTDITGAIVMTKNVTNASGKTEITLGNAPAGVYILSLTIDQKIYKQKIAVW